jgi:hypothetical protein
LKQVPIRHCKNGGQRMLLNLEFQVKPKTIRQR